MIELLRRCRDLGIHCAVDTCGYADSEVLLEVAKLTDLFLYDLKLVGSDDVIAMYRDEIIPFWQGRTMRERIFEGLTDEWQVAYKSGVFTEFMEQRAPGHTTLDGKFYSKGLLDFKQEIAASNAELDFLNESDADARREQLKAMSVACDAVITFAERHAELAEELQKKLSDETPRYGNDDDRVDAIMQMVFDSVINTIDGRPNVRGGEYHVDMLPTTCHIYFGAVLGASADGRRAGTPVSEGISPVQGKDLKGPTAVLNSARKMDQLKTGGTLLNMKFLPEILNDEEGINGLGSLVRTYFDMNGHHIQFNIVDAETLRDAQKNPGKYRDLIVRVAGYSDYYCDIGRELQDEIIARSAQAM